MSYPAPSLPRDQEVWAASLEVDGSKVAEALHVVGSSLVQEPGEPGADTWAFEAAFGGELRACLSLAQTLKSVTQRVPRLTCPELLSAEWCYTCSVSLGERPSGECSWPCAPSKPSTSLRCELM